MFIFTLLINNHRNILSMLDRRTQVFISAAKQQIQTTKIRPLRHSGSFSHFMAVRQRQERVTYSTKSNFF